MRRSTTPPASPAHAGASGTHPLSGALVFLMAVATGLAVANIYYAQPLLETLGRAFGVPAHTAGLIVTMSQVGYAVGLVFVVPLGDLLERRRLVSLLTVATSGALVLAATAPTAHWFMAACLAVGATAVVAQILVPFAAHLAPPQRRGQVVGRVMSGLLLGILLARTVSGVLADVFGWRSVYWLAAAIMLIQAAVLYRALPPDRNEGPALAYGALLRSVLGLLREEPVLRRRIVYGMLIFATFSGLWTALPFLLAHPPFNYSTTVIGAFGLVGAAGAAAASIAGHLHDLGWAKRATGVFLGLIFVAFAVMGFWSHSTVAVVAGVLLLDVGVQGTQILNQSAIYALRPEARSRITTAYMSFYFVGGAAGSAGAAAAFGAAGWHGVAWLGMALPLVGVLYWLSE